MQIRIRFALAAFVVFIGMGASPAVGTRCVAADRAGSIAASTASAAMSGGEAIRITVGSAVPVAAIAVPVASAAAPFLPSPPPAPTVGRARMLRSPSPCHVPPFAQGGPGVPYFVVEEAPRAGHPFRVQWSTKPTSPSDMPAWPAMLFLSFETVAPVSLDAIGASGCHLQVLPEFVMLPTVGSILTQQGGRVNLDWTPTMSVIGQDFYSQLLVFAPGVNGAGFLLSPALHVTVGG